MKNVATPWWRRWNAITEMVVVLIVIILLLVATIANLAGKVTSLRHRTAVLEAELAQARSDLDPVTRERDAKALQLAPFEAMAAVQLGDAPHDQRLDLLVARIKALAGEGAGGQGRRHLDAEALARIREALKDAPQMDVEVGGVLNDPESMLLAKELHSVFHPARFNIRPLAEYASPPTRFAGVSIYSKQEFNYVLNGAVALIFKELSQPAVQWVDGKEIAAAKAGEPPPDLKIVVGSQ